jgi:hypothetical protein
VKIEVRANGKLQLFITEPEGTAQAAAFAEIQSAISKGNIKISNAEKGPTSIVLSVEA